MTRAVTIRFEVDEYAGLEARAKAQCRTVSQQARFELCQAEQARASESKRKQHSDITELLPAAVSSRARGQGPTGSLPPSEDQEQVNLSSSEAKAPDKEFPANVVELTDLLAAQVRGNGFKVTPKQVVAWRADIDRLIRIDCKLPDEVRGVLLWATVDGFWRGNIRSAAKLREKYQELVLKRQYVNGNGARAPTISAVDRGEEFYLDPAALKRQRAAEAAEAS